MQPLNLHKLTPWNLEANTCIFISDLSVNPKTLLSLTFKDIASFHKSPTILVKPEDIVREAKAQNKFLKVSSHTSSINPLRPDISDIEIALIHSSKGNIPDNVLCDMLNVSLSRLKHIRVATAALYKTASTPLPSLPLVTITDTSKYWSEEELLDTYSFLKEDSPKDYGIYYKDLLRTLKSKAESLNLPINDSLYGKKDIEGTVPRRTSIPSTLLEEDHEDYSNLCRELWSYVSREEGIPEVLSFKDGDANDFIEIPISYSSAIHKEGKVKVLLHQHEEGGYNPPLKLPLFIIKLAISLYNLYINNNLVPPSLERLVINLLSSPQYTTSELGVNLPPLSSTRGHCMPTKSKYLRDTPPLIYPKFISKHYGYGVICHKCSTFLSENTTNSCKHMHIDVLLLQETGKFGNISYNLPSIYLYSKVNDSFSPNLGLEYSLYYYNKDIFGSICSIYTLNLLKFYSNYSIPLHRLPYE